MGPRAVVIPFGVPEDARGLGLGLAALVHGAAMLEGEHVALAQLMARPLRDDDPVAKVVEAFIPPDAWRDLSSQSEEPDEVAAVLTGAFEPPSGGRGHFELLIFDPRTGSTRAHAADHVDDGAAGHDIVRIVREALAASGGELGILEDIGQLSWDTLESVLHAERCALHDPVRGGLHDPWAALTHLGRAVLESPSATYPVVRLSALSVLVGMTTRDERLAEAALRAVEGAARDAVERVEPYEAAAFLRVRRGDHAAAEELIERGFAIDPTRARLHAIACEAARRAGHIDTARRRAERACQLFPSDLGLAAERAMVLELSGERDAAVDAFRDVLSRGHLPPDAFRMLTSIFEARGDRDGLARLVDDALASPLVDDDVLRRALAMAETFEPEGIARGARIARLSARLVEAMPRDPWGQLILSRGLLEAGDRDDALRVLCRVRDSIPDHPAASEAARRVFTIEHPRVVRRLERIREASERCSDDELLALADEARDIADAHGEWLAWYTAGVVLKRARARRSARDCFERVLGLAPACVCAHLELVGLLIALGDTAGAVRHSELALELEGETARTLSHRATALLAAGRTDDARAAVDKALALDGDDAASRHVAMEIAKGAPRAHRLRSALGRVRRS